ncbi:MAG: methyltransferase [Caulobacteraceae bacterium]|nr:methyltransferase [Caulobacteraceae bacterium]
MISDIPAFIRENTRVLAPSHVPELSLYLADDAVSLWQLTEDQLGELGLPPPFWAFAWAGGQALARYILDHPETVRGKTVMDVASGSGLVAIAAMKAGARSTLAIDIDAFASHAAVLNAELNSVVVETSGDDPVGKPTDAEVILVGDLFYDRDLAPRVLAWLIEQQAASKTVLIGDPGRTYLPRDQLEQIAAYDIPVTRALEDAEVKRAGALDAALKSWPAGPASSIRANRHPLIFRHARLRHHRKPRPERHALPRRAHCSATGFLQASAHASRARTSKPARKRARTRARRTAP